MQTYKELIFEFVGNMNKIFVIAWQGIFVSQK
jgi:hypothetical protein